MKCLRYISYVFLFLLAAGAAFADVTGRLRGTVKDASGNPIDKVTIKIEATGERPQTYTAVTNAKGEYVHIGIKPNDYRVTPVKEGYVPVEYGYIDLHIAPSDKPVEASFKMQSAQKQAEAKKDAATPSASEGEQGLRFMQEGKFDEAIAAFRKALEADAANPGLHFNLGVAYERKDQVEESRKEYEAAIKGRPDFGEAYFALGNSYMRQQNFDAAVPALTKASELLPGNYNATYNLGACLSNTGKYKEAEEAFKKAVQINPNEPVAHYQLGMSLLGQSRNAEAKAEFQKYLELNPNAADKAEIEGLIETLQ